MDVVEEEEGEEEGGGHGEGAVARGEGMPGRGSVVVGGGSGWREAGVEHEGIEVGPGLGDDGLEWWACCFDKEGMGGGWIGRSVSQSVVSQ